MYADDAVVYVCGKNAQVCFGATIKPFTGNCSMVSKLLSHSALAKPCLSGFLPGLVLWGKIISKNERSRY